MYNIVLNGLLILGFFLLFLNLQKLPIQVGLIIFLFASNVAIILGAIVVKEGMLNYPVKLINNSYFSSNLEFEMLILPVTCLYFYRTTHHSKAIQILIQSVIYSAVLTTIEYFLERHTSLIEYYTWTWTHTFISVIFFLVLTRIFIALIKKKS